MNDDKMSLPNLGCLGNVKQVCSEFLHLLVSFTDRHEFSGYLFDAKIRSRDGTCHARDRVRIASK